MHSKGRGKQKSKTPQELEAQQTERDFLRTVREALPAAAHMRSATRPVQREWQTPICLAKDLGPRGGVAVVPKAELVATLARVGQTQKPTAILTTQPPHELGL
eukprot:6492558-Amphidinium_carterae.6